MSLSSASVFLFRSTVKNRVLKLVRRLRNPRYLIGAAVGALYFYGAVTRSLSSPRSNGRMELELVSNVLAEVLPILLAAAVLWTWLFGASKEPALKFSE